MAAPISSCGAVARTREQGMPRRSAYRMLYPKIRVSAMRSSFASTANSQLG